MKTEAERQMQRRGNLTYLILAVVIVLVLPLLMVVADAEARIAFVSDRVGNSEIYVMDTDGNNQRRLTNHWASDFSPAWSPDGKHIAFTSKRDANRAIYVMDADVGHLRRLTEKPHAYWDPAWSPDGKQIAFVSDRDGNWEIYVMDADGGNLQNLTNEPLEDKDPSWSPDGEQIVFSAQRAGHFVVKLSITNEIYVMDADGDNQERLTENAKYEWQPVWSPDGKRIAFMGDQKGEFQDFGIYVMDVDGSNEQRLTDHPRLPDQVVIDWSPSWSPDSRRIAFASNKNGNFEVYVMHADGSNLQNLTRTPHSDRSPAWLNSPLSVSPAGKKFTMWGWFKQGDR